MYVEYLVNGGEMDKALLVDHPRSTPWGERDFPELQIPLSHIVSIYKIDGGRSEKIIN
jgi:hypothetical protein